jgi:hypothetical protein
MKLSARKDPALKSAVELLANRQTTAALDLLQQQGRVKEILGREERIRTIARSYAESPGNTLIVSPDNTSRCELNMAVRQELRASGAVASEDRCLRVLVQRQDMTGADRAWANHYDAGNVVRYARGSKNVGIEAGSYGAVAAINPSANLLTVEMQSGEHAIYDPRRLTGVSVYREVVREFPLETGYSSLHPTRRSMSPIAILPLSSPSRRMDASAQGSTTTG